MATSVHICGIGGQGVMMLSRILAEAACQSYPFVSRMETRGLSQRGGAVGAQVRFGYAPLAPGLGSLKADLILALDALEGLRNLSLLRHDGTLIANQRLNVPAHLLHSWKGTGALGEQQRRIRTRVWTELDAHPRVRQFDLVRIAGEGGCPKALNTALLGLASSWLPLTLESLKKAMTEYVKTKFRQANVHVFEKALLLTRQPSESARWMEAPSESQSLKAVG